VPATRGFLRSRARSHPALPSRSRFPVDFREPLCGITLAFFRRVRCRNPVRFSGSEPNVKDRTLLRRAITRYVGRHPQASDTLAGIADWWVPKSIQVTPRELERAIEELVADGILRCTTLPGGTKLYSAAGTKR
jgi:hypothetical protein